MLKQGDIIGKDSRYSGKKYLGRPIAENCYKLIDYLGSGAFARVLLAEDLRNPGKKAVIKVLKPREDFDDENQYQRLKNIFVKEYHTLKELDHENIIKAYDVYNRSNTWIALEYVPGKSLEDLVFKKNLRVSIPEAVYITNKIADALSETARKDIVHMDVSPKNILVSDNGIVKLIDFGCAVKSGKLKTFGGTLHYLCPDQPSGIVDPLTDVYGLGIVLYELLTDVVPMFPSGKATIPEIVTHRVNMKDFKPASELNPRIKLELGEDKGNFLDTLLVEMLFPRRDCRINVNNLKRALKYLPQEKVATGFENNGYIDSFVDICRQAWSFITA